MKTHFAKETGLINNKFDIQKVATDAVKADVSAKILTLDAKMNELKTEMGA